MAKLGCLCGNVLSNNSSPEDNIGTIITEKMEARFYNTSMSLYNLPSIEVWECRECGRLALITDNNKTFWYKPEARHPTLLDQVV